MTAREIVNSSLPAAVNTTAAVPAAVAYDASGDSVMSSIQPLIDYITDNQNKTNAYNSAEAAEQRRFQADQASLDRAFNADQAAINRDWQEMMSNTAHQREVRDLLAAGLNPVLSASGGNGASTGSGATASMQSTPNGAKATAGNVNSALVSLFGTLLDNQTKLMMSMSSGANANSYYDTQLALAAMKRQWEIEDREYNKEYYAWQQNLLKENQKEVNASKPGSGMMAGLLQALGLNTNPMIPGSVGSGKSTLDVLDTYSAPLGYNIGSSFANWIKKIGSKGNLSTSASGSSHTSSGSFRLSGSGRR